jgi:hypothetical protein
MCLQSPEVKLTNMPLTLAVDHVGRIVCDGRAYGCLGWKLSASGGFAGRPVLPWDDALDVLIDPDPTIARNSTDASTLGCVLRRATVANRASLNMVHA